MTGPLVIPGLPAAALGRRTLLGGAAAAGLAALLSACSGPSAGSGGGALTLTDDLGNEIVLDAVPERIVVSQWLLPAFWEAGLKPTAVITFMDVDEIAAFAEAGVPTAGIEVLEGYESLSLEALVALDPQLIVLDQFAVLDTLWGFADVETQEKAAAIAPLFAVSADAAAVDGIERRIEIAEQLGAVPDVEGDRADFEDAVARIRTAADAHPGITVAAIGPYADGIWVASAADYPDLALLREHGVSVFEPAGTGTYSWENAADITADVVVIDDRTTEEELAAFATDHPTWSSIPAVAAGQLDTTWRFAVPYSYGAFARALAQVLPTIEAATQLGA
jgi:iron complex transport system substrate-binding protein